MPNVNMPPMPEISPPGIIHNGSPTTVIKIESEKGLPDVRSYRKKFGLLIPATNTSMEHELWSLLLNNPQLEGIGIHNSNIKTPKPQLKSAADLENYKNQIVTGLSGAIQEALLAQPEYLILGMSLEHILRGKEQVDKTMKEAEKLSGLPWSAWHEVAPIALRKINAKRIGLLTPFDKIGNENAEQLFKDLGFEVISSVGFACANAVHIAHVPDSAKEKAVTDLLATKNNKLDAVVQCGTNMSMLGVIDKLESRLQIPVLGINATLLWHALRENGITTPIKGAGRLLLS